jgi:hypothetical protein
MALFRKTDIFASCSVYGYKILKKLWYLEFSNRNSSQQCQKLGAKNPDCFAEQYRLSGLTCSIHGKLEYMSIHIYNSLTKRKEEFVPLNGKTVKIRAG